MRRFVQRLVRSPAPLGPVLLAVTQIGCYVYAAPATGQLTSGSRYAFEITDQGRVALADRLGSGVERIEGTLVGRNGDGYLISVTGLTSIGAGTSHWSGERVTVRPEHVGRVRERRFSRGRTALAVGAVAVAVGTFIATRTLFGSGSEVEPPPPPPGGGS